MSKATEVKYPDCDIYVESVILSGDLIALLFEGYNMILGIDWILAPDLHPAGQMALRFVNTYENLIPTIKGVAQPVFTWTSNHALRRDGRLVESQEGLETEVGPRPNLVGAPGVCSLF
ncbi:hypothetical protein M9H77_17117 [Catharanthus roseus]|uniref:Uncharacterized protein n=1 Tax=Catharanthus roseus TaxID=4058 RepID=A0ACC0B3P6_CATRO|nr:hypothetical protein M9H77_17117 [Catharanthus roseus]